jgi:hypothetical protein
VPGLESHLRLLLQKLITSEPLAMPPHQLGVSHLCFSFNTVFTIFPNALSFFRLSTSVNSMVSLPL